MPSEYDAALTQCVTEARHEVYTAALQATSNERGAHLETALTALGYLAGTAILTDTGIDLLHYTPGTPILVDKVNDVGQEVVGNLLDLVAHGTPSGTTDLTAPLAASIPPGHQPLLPYEDLISLLWPTFKIIVAKHAIPPAVRPYICTGPASYLILEGRSRLSPAICKTIFIDAVVKASKTIPPRQAAAPANIAGNAHQQARPSKKVALHRKAVAMMIVALVLVLIVVFFMASAMTIKVPHGSPIGLSSQTNSEIATLIQTLEPYIPSLNRNHGEDRYRISLFLFPLDGISPSRMIPLATGQVARDEVVGPRNLGDDGRYLWIFADGIQAVEHQTSKVLNASDFRRTDPAHADLWVDEMRQYSFESRLHVASPNSTTTWEIAPDTLTAHQVKRKPEPISRLFPHKPDAYLSPGVFISPTEWLGLHSPEEVAREFKPGSWPRRVPHATDTKVSRNFYRGVLNSAPQEGTKTVVSMTPLSDGSYFNAAFLQITPESKPLRLSEPDSFLMVYTSGPGLQGTLMIARVDTSGTIVWKIDTGVDRVEWRQVLSDASRIAFIGRKPRIPDKVAEPILVIVNIQSGAITTSSLWQ